MFRNFTSSAPYPTSAATARKIDSHAECLGIFPPGTCTGAKSNIMYTLYSSVGDELFCLIFEKKFKSLQSKIQKTWFENRAKLWTKHKYLSLSWRPLDWHPTRTRPQTHRRLFPVTLTFSRVKVIVPTKQVCVSDWIVGQLAASGASACQKWLENSCQ